MYGADFSRSELVLRITVLSSIFMVMSAIAAQALASMGKMWPSLFIHILWATLLIALSELLTFNNRLIAVSVALAISYAAQAALFYLYAHWYLSKTRA
jgi:O-antigen/teichoic acid export membrane protein